MAMRVSYVPARYNRGKNEPLSQQQKGFKLPSQSDNNSDMSLHSSAISSNPPSPGSLMGRSSNNSVPSPNGYAADYSQSEASSVASVHSYRQNVQYLDPKGLRNNRMISNSSVDSGVVLPEMAQSIASSAESYRETDLDTPDEHPRTRSDIYPHDEARYDGELFKPQAAPRTLTTQKAKTMFGEKHPKLLKPEELPGSSSGEDIDDTSSAASVSTVSSSAPRPAPRASMRVKKGEANTAFDDDETAGKLERSQSFPRRSIIKSRSRSADSCEDGEGRFVRTASGRKVRFEAVPSKQPDSKRRTVDYAEIDKSDSKKKAKNTDIWNHIQPVSPKPARNDPKRSSKQGRQARSSSHERGSADGSSTRSSSGDRSSQRGRSSSKNKDASSSKGKDLKTANLDRPKELKQDDVKIEIKQEAQKHESMMQEISRTADKQKICKWVLIVGIPLIIVGIVGVVVGLILK